MSSKIELDTKTFIRFWLVIIGFALLALLIYKAATGLIIIGAALFFALAISPLVKKLAKFLPGGIQLSIAVAYVLIVGLIALVVAVVVPTVVNESVRFMRNMPTIINNMTSDNGVINSLGRKIGIKDLQNQVVETAANASGEFIKNFGNSVTTSLGTLANLMAVLILVLALGFFMLTEGPQIMTMFWKNFQAYPGMPKVRRSVDHMAKVISSYVSNAITVSLMNAVATACAVFVLALIFNFSPGLALPFGMITGVFSLIPMFGSFVGGCVVAGLVGMSAWGAGLAFLFYTLVYLQIESNVISPKIQGRGLRLPALVVLASVTIGVYMFGLIGAIVAIPIAGCIKVFLEDFGEDLKPDFKPEPKLESENAKPKEKTSLFKHLIAKWH